MKNIVLLRIALIALIALISCEPEENPPEPILGCTDENSLDFDSRAEKNDGSCSYSNSTYYASASTFNNIQISEIQVFVNGTLIGNTNSVIYPNGPGNCSAPGTVPFQFENGDSVDWNAVIFLADGSQIFTNGMVEPFRTECIRINVTR